MANQYDEIGKAYDGSKSIPATQCHEATMRKYLGDVTGLSILDLACGTGDYSRKLVSQGAAHVTGVDLSTGMISAAKEQTGDDPKITYLIADCLKPLRGLPRQQYDLVLGAWFLNYAKNEDELTSAWQNVATYLKPGGRFVGLKPTWDPEGCNDWYGVTRRPVQRLPHGKAVQSRVGANEKVTFVNYVLKWELYQSCAEKVGMKGLKIEDLVLPQDATDMSFWQPFLDQPTFELITAVRA